MLRRWIEGLAEGQAKHDGRALSCEWPRNAHHSQHLLTSSRLADLRNGAKMRTRSSRCLACPIDTSESMTAFAWPQNLMKR